MTNKSFRVKHGLEVGDSVSIDAATGDITTAGDIRINGNEIKSSTGATAITLDAGNTTINGNLTVAGTSGYIYSDTGLALTLDGNNVTVAGNLTVSGTTTTLNTENLLVEDKNVIIGNVATPTNVTGNGGGITLKAAADKTITWDSSVDRWTTNVGLEAGGRLSTDAGFGLVVSELNFEGNTVSGFGVSGSTGDASLYGDLYIGGSNTGSDLVLNSLTTASAANNATISVERGTDPNARLIWDETTDKWRQTRNDSNYYDIPISTAELAEQTNLYYTDARSRAAITVSDAGGDGSITYNSTTGQITYTGPSAAEVRAHISGGTGVTITNGSVAIGQAVGTTDDVQFDQVTATNLVTAAIQPASGNLTLTTVSTGDINLTTANGGNVVASRNLIFGAVRDATTDTNGDMWSFASGTAGAFRGVSVDNSTNTAKRPGYVVRSFSGGATGPRTDFIYEVSRGTAASPTAIQTGDFIGEVHATGRTSTGWLSDLVTATPAGNTYYAAENWVGITNNGAGWGIQLQPTNTTLTAGGASRTTVYDTNPQYMYMRNDAMVFSSGKTTGFVATGCSVSGTTLTIGTVTSGTVAVGRSIQTALQGLQGAYIVANISGSGNGSTWTISQSQANTLSGVTIVGNIGFMGTADGGTTMDMLRTLRVMDGTMRSATNSYAFDNNAGTDLMTIAANGTVRMLDPTVPAQRLEYISAIGSASDDNNTLTIQQNSPTANDHPVFNFYNRRTTDNVNFTPTQNNDVLGGFKFNGQTATSTTPAIGLPTQVRAFATENWTGSAQGSRVDIAITRKGTTSGIVSLSSASDQTTMRSDAFLLEDSTGIDMLSLTTTRAKFFQPVEFPVLTAAAATAITGSVGQQICISNSAGGSNPNGMMAFWDTTNSRWSYIHDNTAV